MKKIICLFFAAAVSLSMVSCGILDKIGDIGGIFGKKSTAAQSTGSVSQCVSIFDTANGEVDFKSVFAGSIATKLSSLSDNDKQKIIDEGKKEGVNVIFNSNGSTVFISENGDEATQNADGSWTEKNGDGSISQIGGAWPSNNLTKLLPKPDFGTLTAANTSSAEFTATYTGVSLDDAKAYVEKIKSKGFTSEQKLTDQKLFGVTVYLYEATDSSSSLISVGLTSGIFVISLNKAK